MQSDWRALDAEREGKSASAALSAMAGIRKDGVGAILFHR